MILAGQSVSATQMIVEELFLKKKNFHPLQVNFVGFTKENIRTRYDIEPLRKSLSKSSTNETILLASKVFLSYLLLKGNETQLLKVGKLI